jgi:hypothetical protein
LPPVPRLTLRAPHFIISYRIDPISGLNKKIASR